VTTYGGYWSVLSYPEANCAAVFVNHITEDPDIYDPNAVVHVTCTGEWQFVWHEINDDCEGVDTVIYNFYNSPYLLYELPIQRTCSNQVQTSIDTIGLSNNIWHWAINPSFPYSNQDQISFDPYNPQTTIYRNFPDEIFGDSGHVDVPLILSMYTAGCLTTKYTSVTFYQKPNENAFFVDTIISGSNITLNVPPTSTNNSALWSYADGSYMPYPDDQFSHSFEFDTYGNYGVAFHETNELAYGHPSCTSSDTVILQYSTASPVNFSFLVDTSSLYLPFLLNSSTVSNISEQSGTYFWSVYEGNLANASNLIYEANAETPDFEFLNAGTYLITLQIINNKSLNSIAKYAIINIQANTLSIDELLIKQHVFPNPTKGKFFVNSADVETIEVYDIKGKLIMVSRDRNIDLSQEAKGIYHLRITSHNSIRNQKIVLE
jgi:hypothetical protein